MANPNTNIPNSDMITHVPSAEALQARAEEREAQDGLTSHTLSRGAFEAALKGATGSAADLNLQFPLKSSAEVYKAPPSKVPDHEPHETPDAERMVSRQDLDKMLEQLKGEGKL